MSQATVHSEPSIRVVLDWYRRRLTADRFANRQRVVIPVELAGWVTPTSSDPTDSDGLLPLGVVRDRLLHLIEHADLTAQERTVVLARSGLSEYPVHSPSRPLGQRIPVQRRRKPGGLGDRRLRALFERAIARLDDAGVIRPGPASVIARPVPDPAQAPWFTARVPEADRLRVVEEALEVARSFVSLPGFSSDTEGPLRDLDAYAARMRARGELGQRPTGRSRAHALIGLCAWDLTASEQTGNRMAEAAGSGRVAAPPEFTHASEALGRILAGSATSQIVLTACEEPLELAKTDRESADVVADLLLGFFRSHSSRIGPNAGSTLLRAVIRIRAANEDPTALTLARRAIAQYPLRWQTVDAAQAAVRVASAHRLFRRAHQLCSYVDAALVDGITLPEGRERLVEDAEYGFWNLHQRSATIRRELDLEPTPRSLRLALEVVAEVDRAQDRVLLLNNTVAAGDAAPSWAYYVDVRAAEVHLSGSAALGESDQAGHLRAARTRAERARRVARAVFADHASLIPLTKVELRESLIVQDEARAIHLLWELHGVGWPLARSLPAVRDASVGSDTSLPRSVVSTIREIARLEQLPGHELLVDDSNQRRLGG